MPIMAPLASFANVPPELVVTAYQTGWPGGPNLADLGGGDGRPRRSRVGYGTWLKFVWPLGDLAILCMAVMSVAVVLG